MTNTVQVDAPASEANGHKRGPCVAPPSARKLRRKRATLARRLNRGQRRTGGRK